MSRKRPLSAEEIIAALSELADSEDGLDSDDDSIVDADYIAELETFEDEDPEVDNDEDYIIESVENFDEGLTSNIENAQTQEITGQHSYAKNTRLDGQEKPGKLNLRWKKKNLELNEEQLMFIGNNTLGPELLELDTPEQFFFYLFPHELINKISEETNLYQVQKDANSPFRTSEEDVRQFIGVVYLMSLIQLPRVTKHWSPVLGTPLIQETMTLNKFEKIRQTLHFNDNSKDLPRSSADCDRLYKIRPVVNSLNAAFSKVPLEEHLCVDEQMCSTKARNALKRYNPNKPHKWGYKVFVLSGKSGFAYNTEVETGKENKVLQGEPDLGASSNVVVRLARIIPRHQKFKIYFDNYFTSLRLMEYLAKGGILSLGTIRRNRIPDCKLTSEKLMQKKERGYSEEYVADVNGIDVTTVAWKDNRIVNLASTFAGQSPETDVKRWDKSNSRYVYIRRPNVVGVVQPPYGWR